MLDQRRHRLSVAPSHSTAGPQIQNELRLAQSRRQRACADRSGLGAPASTAVQQAELEAERQAALDLRRVLEEHDDELAAARETNRRLMNQINRPGNLPFPKTDLSSAVHAE